MSSGYALARESLKRIQAMSEGDRLRRSERQLIEDEQLINVFWMFGQFFLCSEARFVDQTWADLRLSLKPSSARGRSSPSTSLARP